MGTVQFIGQLYNKDLLTNQICKFCLTSMVTNHPRDLEIECCYRMLLTIGEKYDATPQGKKHLDQLFTQLQQMV
eukprot:UN02075